jgi:branched-chain amino acid transport system substrate-binding protein
MNFNKKIIKRIFIITAVGLSLAMTFGGYLGTKRSFAEEPIKIGASLSLTGKYAWTGKRMYEGYKTWEKLINQRGYSPGLEKYGHTEPGLINGRPVKFIIYDDKSDPATGVKLYQKLITSDKVDLVHGPYSSAVTKAISPVIERAQIPCVTSGASDPAIWRARNLKWVVQGMPTTDEYSPGVAEIGAKHKAKTAAIIFEDTSFPIALANSTRKHLEKADIKIVLFEAYPKGITDWTPPLSKAWALKPDIIGIGGYEPDAIGLTKAAQAIKATPKLFYWTVATYSPHYAESVGDAAYGMIGEVVWDQSANTPGNKEYVKAFEEIIGTPISKQVEHAAMGFFGCQLLEIAVKKVSSLNRRAIRDTLFNMEVETIVGPYKVDPLESKNSGIQTAYKCSLIQWQKRKPGAKLPRYKAVIGDYVREIVWPEKFKSADPIYPFPGWER